MLSLELGLGLTSGLTAGLSSQLPSRPAHRTRHLRRYFERPKPSGRAPALGWGPLALVCSAACRPDLRTRRARQCRRQPALTPPAWPDRPGSVAAARPHPQRIQHPGRPHLQPRFAALVGVWQRSSHGRLARCESVAQPKYRVLRGFLTTSGHHRRRQCHFSRCMWRRCQLQGLWHRRPGGRLDPGTKVPQRAFDGARRRAPAGVVGR